MADPRQTTVQVILYSVDATDKGKFDLKPVGSDPLPPPQGTDKTLQFDNNRHPGVKIDFVLIDKTGADYGFFQDPDQAVSSDWGPTSVCPPQGRHNVLKPLKVSGDNNSVLTVFNKNDKSGQTFGYALWLTNAQGAQAVIDPGGNNMNGPQSFRFSAVVAALAGVVVGAAVMALMFNWSAW